MAIIFSRIIVFVCVLTTTLAYFPDDCIKDLDYEKGYYCSSHSTCEICILCKRFISRHSPHSAGGEVLCAKGEKNCGGCLPGYQADEAFCQDYSVKICHRSTDTFETSDPKPNHSPERVVSIISIGLVLVFSGLGLRICLRA